MSSPTTGITAVVQDTISLANYLALFRSVPYENIDKLIPEGQKDSIRMTTPPGPE